MIKETKNVCRVQIIDAKLIPFRSILISVKKISVRMHYENKNIEGNIFISVYIAESNLLTAWMMRKGPYLLRLHAGTCFHVGVNR